MNTDSLDTLRSALAGHYTIDREVGRGGMGTVFVARESNLDRVVAIKVLPRHLAANPELRQRFLREARTAAQLSHPHIVPIFRADEMDGFAFFTMAFIDGENLAERLKQRGPLPASDVVRMLRETAWALAYAHARGVVHRDVKPENIMIERGTNRAIVTDFGIARDQLTSSITGDGMVMGTAHYMSPEQASGDKVDGRSDLYSLGIVGYQLLSGQRPFDADEVAAVMAQQVTRQPPSLGVIAAQVPASLVAVIDRCLRKSPADRYQTGEALADALLDALGTNAVRLSSGDADESVNTDQARAIWLRAAQLQADAGTRLQQRYQRDADSSAQSNAPMPESGFRIRDVEQAAVEAGIGADYVAMAIAERHTQALVTEAEVSPALDRRLTQMMGSSERSITCTRTIRAPIATTLESIGRVFTAHPYLLRLRDTVGGHPLDGGIMVFDVPLMSMTQMSNEQPSGMTAFSYRMTQIAAAQLNVVLRPTSAGDCDVTVFGDLRSGMLKNWKVDKWLAGFSGSAGAFLGGMAGVFSALSLGALAVVPAMAGGAVAGGLALVGYRALYRSALKHAKKELEGLLMAIEGNMRAQSVFGLSNTDRQLKP